MVVICVGHPLRLVVGVQFCVCHLLSARGAGMAHGCWWCGGGGRLNVRAHHHQWRGRRPHSSMREGLGCAFAFEWCRGSHCCGISIGRWRRVAWWLCLQVVSGWVTDGGYALGAETAVKSVIFAMGWKGQMQADLEQAKTHKHQHQINTNLKNTNHMF